LIRSVLFYMRFIYLAREGFDHENYHFWTCRAVIVSDYQTKFDTYGVQDCRPISVSGY
jgi:hypothetical protein